MDRNIEMQVIAFLSYFSAIPIEKISLSSSIPRDLHIEGDDAVELFEKLSTTFNVDVSKIDLSDYFVRESQFNPVTVLVGFILGCSRTKKDLTVQDLVNVVLEANGKK